MYVVLTRRDDDEGIGVNILTGVSDQLGYRCKCDAVVMPVGLMTHAESVYALFAMLASYYQSTETSIVTQYMQITFRLSRSLGFSPRLAGLFLPHLQVHHSSEGSEYQFIVSIEVSRKPKRPMA